MVRFDNVTKIFQDTDTTALKNLNFYMEPGELCFLKGDSGSGKTTMLRLLLGELKPDSGNVYVNGKNVAQISRRKLPYYRRNIGFVFQDFKLIEDMDIFQNVALTRYVDGTADKSLHTQVTNALRMVGMEKYFQIFPSELSGGERQRVAIARALVGNPSLILADEPTGNLDPTNSRSIMELLGEIHERIGLTVLIATHDNEAIEGIKGSVFELENDRA